MICLGSAVGGASTKEAGYTGSNPGSGENLSLKLTEQNLSSFK